MPNTREMELWRLVNNAFQNSMEKFGDIFAKDVTRYLLANGVTFAKDNNVPSKWIPVSERLPEKDVLVLCIGSRGGMFLGQSPWLFSDGSAYFDVPNSRRARFATHWMPLPEPPKGELQ